MLQPTGGSTKGKAANAKTLSEIHCKLVLFSLYIAPENLAHREIHSNSYPKQRVWMSSGIAPKVPFSQFIGEVLHERIDRRAATV